MGSIVSADGLLTPLMIDAPSKAARTTIYDKLGNAITVPEGNSVVSAPNGMPIMGIYDGAFRFMRIDRAGNVRTGADTLMFKDNIESVSLNTNIWNTLGTNFVLAQTLTGGISLNSTSLNTLNSYYTLYSQKQFAKVLGTTLKYNIRLNYVKQNNATFEFGFGLPSTTVAQVPTGSFFRFGPTGTMVPVLSFNNVDIVLGADFSSLINPANSYSYSIFADDDSCVFIVRDTATGLIINDQELQVPSSQPKIWSVPRLPIFHRLMIVGSATITPPQAIIEDVSVIGLDVVNSIPYAEQKSILGASSTVTQGVWNSTANITNNTAPANATLSNTTAGYTTEGGMFSFAAVAGAATDYMLFSYTVPTNQGTLIVTNITIDTYTTGTTSATTPTLLHWFVADNCTATGGSTALNREHLGVQSIPVGSVSGYAAGQINVKLNTPLRTEPGRTLQIILRMPVSTATAGQVIQDGVRIEGYND